MGVAAPVIEAEMADWVALGGGNSGIVGDPATHTYGFHLDANSVGPDDYSRWRDPNGANGPYVNWNYSCAGDFSHGFDERLRAMHRNVLARLMRSELPMICEFIGKPWADQPVYYWSRWGGLQRYTGAGHDHWSHISWYRSRVDQRAYLWVPEPTQIGDDMILTIVPGPNNTKWLCNGMGVRKISGQKEIDDLLYLDSLGAIKLWKRPDGNPIWDGGLVPAFGVDIATLGVAVDEAAIATQTAALVVPQVIAGVGKPLTFAETVDASFQGHEKGERQ